MLPTLALLLVGVASDRSQGWRDRHVSAEDTVLPFDRYRLTAAEQVLVNRARHILVTQCMRTAGHPDVTIPPSLVGAVDRFYPNSRRYGVADEHTVRQFGFHLPPDTASDARSAKLDGWLAGLSGPEEVALHGTGAKPGCLDTAATKLPRVGNKWLTNLDFTSLERSMDDARVVAAIREWRTCMTRAGLPYTGPYEAVADEQWNLESPTISQREIKVATADVRCKHETRLLEIWIAVETEIQEDQIRRNPARFARLAEARRLIRVDAERTIELAGT